LGAAAIVLVSAGVVSADELRVLDTAGKTRSVADLATGSSAAVKVTLNEKLTIPVSINLLSANSKEIVQSTTSDEKGLATFKNIAPGSYTVTTNSAQATVANVEIITSAAGDQGTVEDNERNVSRSMYVAGASAVAGVLGVSLANSGGSGDSVAATTEAAGTVKNTVNSGVPSFNPDGSADDIFQTSGAVGAFDVPPSPGSVSPPPTTITVVSPPTSPIGTPIAPTQPSGLPQVPVTPETTPVAPPPTTPPPLSGS
jgi:hypothetical protein